MKNKLYGIFDRVTMVFSPLVESLFAYAEVWSAHRAAQKSGGAQTTSDSTALRDRRATGTRHRESFGW